MKKLLCGVCFLLILAGLMIFGVSAAFTEIKEDDSLFFTENNRIYINLDKIMVLQDYVLSDKTADIITYKYINKNNQPEIVINFDLKNEKATKNEFKFDIKNGIKIKNEEFYLYRDFFRIILNVNVAIPKNNIIILPLSYVGHSWIYSGNGLVAHAGGWVSERSKAVNCRESIINSYNIGHRVFELDFNLTTDGKLAVVHDWAGYSGMKSSDEWKKTKIWGVYTSMMLEDVLDIMLVNKDMLLITDTKSFDYTIEQTKEQFKIIVETAMKKDPSHELLKRIIPQIYNQPMYNIVMDQYKFQSIIYTLYMSKDKENEVIEFVKKHPVIKVVTMPPERGNPGFVKKIKNAGKYIYYHTINDLDEIKNYKKDGIWGFYTDNIYPSLLK